MLTVGVAQIRNSTDIEANFSSISSFLSRFEDRKVDLVLFPECALSGFSSKIAECTLDRLNPFLTSVNEWSAKTGIHVALPTAIAEQEKIYNSGFWIADGKAERFQKLDLTESEKRFFSTSTTHTNKIFNVRGYRCALLLCMEAEQSAQTHFASGAADLVLWPGYWGWTMEDDWSATSLDQKPNRVFENMVSWKLPLIQSNFAFNDLSDNRKGGPEGLSVVVRADNTLHYRGAHRQEHGFVVSLEQRIIRDCSPL